MTRPPRNFWLRLPGLSTTADHGRGYACHVRISDKLLHVLVAVNDQAKIDRVGRGASLQKLNLSLQLFGGFPSPCVAPLGAPARFQLARSYALAGHSGRARSTYQNFFALWRDADPAIPILKEAQAEYAKLR